MFSAYKHDSQCNFDTDTSDRSIKAPRQVPIECQVFPPEFKLQEPSIEQQICKLALEQKQEVRLERKGSLDNHYSILAFIDRKIKESSRQRVMSEQIRYLQL